MLTATQGSQFQVDMKTKQLVDDYSKQIRKQGFLVWTSPEKQERDEEEHLSEPQQVPWSFSMETLKLLEMAPEASHSLLNSL